MAFDTPVQINNKPVILNWKVTRGDTSTLLVEFLEVDEATYFDLSGWTFEATAYNPKTTSFDELDVSVGNGSVTITASSDITESWGTGVSSNVAELSFDLQVILPDGTVWTPVMGTIGVRGDVTGGTL